MEEFEKYRRNGSSLPDTELLPRPYYYWGRLEAFYVFDMEIEYRGRREPIRTITKKIADHARALCTNSSN
jgi:hypothetical protein